MSNANSFIDTNVIVRHLTGDPAEEVYVLESFYKVPRLQVAEFARATVAFPAIRVDDPAMLLRAIEVYEKERLDFADVYLVAVAERSGVGVVASAGV